MGSPIGSLACSGAGEVERAEATETEPEGGQLVGVGAVQLRGDVHDVSQAPAEAVSILQETVHLLAAAL